METKICSKCREEKSVSEFYRKTSSKDGYMLHCKKCDHAKLTKWKEENSERYKLGRKEYYKKYAEENLDKIRAAQREYVKTHKDEISAYGRATRDRYREYHKAYNKIYSQTEKCKITMKRYSDTNKDAIKTYQKSYRSRLSVKLNNRIKSHMRRAKVKGLAGYHTSSDLEDIFIEQLGKCVYCGCSLHKSYSIDHIIPVSRLELNPTNFSYNLQLLCGSCNSSKNTKTHEEYLDYLSKVPTRIGELNNAV